MPQYIRQRLGRGATAPHTLLAASDAPIQPNITTQSGKRVAGALKFWGYSSSLVNSYLPFES